MKKITADKIFSGSGEVWTDKVLVLDESGRILDISPLEDHDASAVERYAGVLLPGFINAHCHLELSHMKGVIPTGTGLLPFLKGVVSLRDFDPEFIARSIAEADQEMQNAGIVAVGDISNKADTAPVKRDSPIHYHTFVEVFDFMQEHMTDRLFDQAREVWEAQSGNALDKKTIVPHAPYSVSAGLMARINKFNQSSESISIHNQETWHEDAMFRDRSGDFIPLWESFGFNMDHFTPTGTSSLEQMRGQMRADQRVLLVHNTETTPDDIRETMAWNEETYWVSCPNANLYIENRLPRYDHFIGAGARVCLGTDSLSSNWQLSILEEMKTIQRYQSGVSFGQLVTWACANGARALGYDNELGTFAKGKRPGVLFIDMDPETLTLKAHHQVVRLA